MRINHNIYAMNAQRHIGISISNKKKTMEKLSSGYKVNRAADDAAGLSISEKMRCQIRGLKQGSQNLEDGISFLQTGEGALDTVHKILDRMEELSVQAANDVYEPEDRQAIQNEMEMLRDEINNISRTTEFNGYKIFETGFAVNFSDDMIIVGIFDANNGDPEELESYGGIIINGNERVPWSNIDPDLVYTDEDTGQLMFHQGTYTYNTGTYDLTIESKEGSTKPDLKISFQLFADADGISIADYHVPWSEVVDDRGTNIFETLDGHEQYYHFSIGSAMGSFSINNCNTIDDVIDGINIYNTKYERLYVNEYDGYYRAKAVDIQEPNSSKMRVTNDFVVNVLPNSVLSLDISLGADSEAVWLNDLEGNMIEGSKKTWEELHLSDWMEGTDISDQSVYVYTFSNDVWDVKYEFQLLNETSQESVIDGINNAVMKNTSQRNNNQIKAVLDSNEYITGSFQSISQNFLDVIDKVRLGRNFDIQSEEFASQKMSYDENTQRFQVTYMDLTSPGNSALELESKNLTSGADIKEDAKTYTAYLTARQVQALIKGYSTASDSTLSDVLEAEYGSGHVTTSGHLTELLSKSYIDSLTNKAGAWTASSGESSQFSAAVMDFSGIDDDNFDLYDLLGTGFNSTCNTCDRHYSVMFTYFDENDSTVQSTSQGFRYSLDGNQNSSDPNMLLEIDINSLSKHNIQSGEALTAAIINVIKESGFAYHYQSYAADGSKLYVCENRSSLAGYRSATFDTKPYEVESATISFNLYSSPFSDTPAKNVAKLTYDYDLKNAITAEADMYASSNGMYIKDGDIYREYDPDEFYDKNGDLLEGAVEPERYSITLTNNISSWNTLYNDIMNDIADMTTINLTATDYDYLMYSNQENNNSAVASTFDYRIEDNKKFWIQSGANAGEGLYLNWDCFNAYTLGLGNLDISSHETAQLALNKVQNAITKISEIRSGFGAYMNRLEFDYNNNRNYEENLQEAESRIRDTDMAEEMTSLSKHNILVQAGQSILTQANQQNQSVLQLLQ